MGKTPEDTLSARFYLPMGRGAALSLGLHGLVLGALVLGRAPVLPAGVLPVTIELSFGQAAEAVPAPEPPAPARPRAAPARMPVQRRPALAPARAPGSPTAAPAQDDAAMAAAAAAGPSPNWLAALVAWLAAHRHYPEEARRDGVEGAAVVRFTVDREGRVLAVALLRGSGSEALDGAAVAMLSGARVPPFPAEMPGAEQTVTVPIQYRLERGRP